MSDDPELSVILATRDRAALLPLVLAGFEKQTLVSARYEIVVIDDGSTDQTLSVLAGWQGRLPLRIIPQRAAGLAAAKNLGVFASRAPILVFADDDDVPEPGYLTAHLAAHLRHRDPAVAVLAQTVLDPTIADVPIMRHVTGPGGQLFYYKGMVPEQIVGFKEFWGGRSSCKRALLTEYGVFNPAFEFGCEDIELAWRLQVRRGIAVIFVPAAQTRMIRALTFDGFCDRSIRQGRSQWLFAHLHPDPLIRHYCEVDQAIGLWEHYRGDFAAILRWARRLDAMMLARAGAGLPLLPESQNDLDAAYRFAFQLCRAKGVADAASLPPVTARPEACDARRMGFLKTGTAGMRLTA